MEQIWKEDQELSLICVCQVSIEMLNGLLAMLYLRGDLWLGVTSI